MNKMSHARGLMEGVAVGNLLGIPFEGWPKSEVAAAQPEGIREITACSGFPDDDDLALSIVIAEAATEGPLDIDDLGRRFWTWAEINGAGIGGLTRRVLTLYGGDCPQRLARNKAAGDARAPRGIPIRDASKQGWEGDRAGNGALMRCAPLALRWEHDSDPSTSGRPGGRPSWDVGPTGTRGRGGRRRWNFPERAITRSGYRPPTTRGSANPSPSRGIPRGISTTQCTGFRCASAEANRRKTNSL